MENIIVLVDWITKHSSLITTLAVLSVLSSFLYAIGVFVAVVRMSPQYFVQNVTSEKTWQGQHPLLHVFFKGLKNLAGLGIIVLGVAMLLLPGQGILTILIGLTLLDFPGKRRLEIWFVRRSSILNGINRIRKKARREPLKLP